VRTAVLTVSDRVSRGEADDGSGDLLEELLREDGHEVERRTVADERPLIAAAITELAHAARLVLTTGGTGLAPRDVTPEATRAVIDREAVGIAERIRVRAMPNFPRAALGRGVAGVRGHTLIVNLPGSPSAVRDGLDALDQIVQHACDVLSGKVTEHTLQVSPPPASPPPASPVPLQ
jgi:molybdopterin adenylyltransferase